MYNLHITINFCTRFFFPESEGTRVAFFVWWSGCIGWVCCFSFSRSWRKAWQRHWCVVQRGESDNCNVLFRICFRWFVLRTAFYHGKPSVGGIHRKNMLSICLKDFESMFSQIEMLIEEHLHELVFMLNIYIYILYSNRCRISSINSRKTNPG